MKQFHHVRVKKPRSNLFDLSHEKKLTMKMGKLVPVFMEEVIPGDRFSVNMESLVRLHPMLAPVMHRINVYTHFFFVPYRLVWSNFENFITGGDDGLDDSSMPMITGDYDDFSGTQDWGLGTLVDYLGLPTNDQYSSETEEAPEISQLPFRAYQQIYNDYYRDETLQTEITIPKDDANITCDSQNAIFYLRDRCWEKDYFTSALPWAQRGNPVYMPLGIGAPVTGKPLWQKVGGGSAQDGAASFSGSYLYDIGPSQVEIISTGLNADLSSATSSTINEVRRAFAVQRWMEKSARGGYRYIEQILSHFGVKSKDERLQRAEYLGGGKQPVIISEVLQTSKNETGSPLGDLGGHGYSAGGNASFNKSFTEHGIVLGIMSILPRTAYQQGIPRFFRKDDKYDFYWPELAHIGEQEVENCELYVDASATDLDTFGYQSRYAEYRYKMDTVHGDFRDSLDFWHMGRIFSSKPSLNSTFVKSNPTERIFSELTYDPCIVQVYTNFKAIRPIAKFGDPI